MIVITCPRCKHVFQIATPPISGTVACPSCNKGLRLRPKTSADVLPAMERRPAKSSRRAMMVGLGFLILVVGVGIAYKLRPKRVKGAATKPGSTTTRPTGAGPATTGPTTKPIPRRPRGVPPGYQIGPD